MGKNKKIIIGILTTVLVVSVVLAGFFIKTSAAKSGQREEKIYAMRGHITKIGEELTSLETEDGSGWDIESDRVSVAQFLKSEIIVVINDKGSDEIYDDEIISIS